MDKFLALVTIETQCPMTVNFEALARGFHLRIQNVIYKMEDDDIYYMNLDIENKIWILDTDNISAVFLFNLLKHGVIYSPFDKLSIIKRKGR